MCGTRIATVSLLRVEIGLSVNTLNLCNDESASFNQIPAAICWLPPFRRPWPAIRWSVTNRRVTAAVEKQSSPSVHCIRTSGARKLTTFMGIVMLWRPSLDGLLPGAFGQYVVNSFCHISLSTRQSVFWMLFICPVPTRFSGEPFESG